jgi:NitT/TauT family transport system substrate-binding protein
MNRQWFRLAVAVAAAVVGASTLTGCGAGDSAGASDGAATLRLGYFPNITHAPALVGVQNGIFADKLGPNVKLTTKTFNAGPSAIEALFSGAIDATYIGPNPTINGWARSEGSALKIIAGATSGGAALVVRDGITSVDDLRGKKIATPQLANTQDVALRYWLGQHGLKADQHGGGDVSVLPTPNPETVAAFESGAIDGAWVPEPYASQLVAEHNGKVLVNEKDEWPGGQFVTTHLIVRTQFLKDNPGLVKRLLQGHIEAVAYANQHPAEAQKAANEHLAALSGKPLPTNIIAAAFKNLTFTVDPVAASLQDSAAHAQEVGLLDPIKLKGIYDLGPLNELLRASGRPPVNAGELAP